MPIFLEETVESVEIANTDYSRTVVEGNTFEIPITIQVNYALANKLVVAKVYDIDGD